MGSSIWWGGRCISRVPWVQKSVYTEIQIYVFLYCPRLHGEHTPLRPRRVITTGSFPHTRGTLSIPELDGVACRLIPARTGKTRRARAGSRGRAWLIPAHTGNTAGASGAITTSTAHPCSRGDDTIDQRIFRILAGSFPHMRGTPGRRAFRRSRHGPIPAHAGTTAAATLAVLVAWAPPRTHGEHGPGCSRTAGSGSFPHTRGRPWCGGVDS